MTKLNLGCGRDKREGYVNIDASDEAKPDLTLNIEFDRLPYEDGTVEEVLAYNVLEQISCPRHFVNVMNELWRVVKTGGRLLVRVPNAEHICAFQDPMDVMRFTENSFDYMAFRNKRYEEFGQVYGFKPWVVNVAKGDGKTTSEGQLLVKLQPVK